MSLSTLLPLEDYSRYGRQMVLDGIGLPGQIKLQQSSVVVVGAGGLGCPALQYLGAAGVGRLGIIDHDHVEISNLQRQILHTEQTIGMNKAESASLSLKRLNPRLNIEVVDESITAENARSLLQSYDIILDCTDNVPTRYLLSDTAVNLGKPLVSGAAQKFEGQLCTYNLGLEGPCYRCLFPTPPLRETVLSCEESGILGVVTGVIGNMQALEAIKIILGLHDNKPSLLLFSALSWSPFRTIKLRSRKPSCPTCRDVSKEINLNSIDYVQFCGGSAPDWETQGRVPGKATHRIMAKDLVKVIASKSHVNIIDVRPNTEFGICCLPSSCNVPLKEFLKEPVKYVPENPSAETYVVCRLGNDSQIAAESLRCMGFTNVKDLIGGLKAWSEQVDNKFPVY
ncbi:hypothetical protein BDQ17DRAFT_1307842 [Cyathus striatus]|nr:hypothetical protein BDQ17DRAFT_1307842 [Cyathus striatus]